MNTLLTIFNSIKIDVIHLILYILTIIIYNITIFYIVELIHNCTL